MLAATDSLPDPPFIESSAGDVAAELAPRGRAGTIVSGDADLPAPRRQSCRIDPSQMLKYPSMDVAYRRLLISIIVLHVVDAA